MTTTIVVPCYNEARRLPARQFQDFVALEPEIDFLFVNDGSTDATAAVLRDLVAVAPERFRTLDLPENRGKAEAVRLGVLAALEGHPTYVGYWDADLATPLDEIPRFVKLLDERPDREFVFGSRVKLLGRDIQRRALRHYLGRVFATVASMVLRLAIYDTQCGAKLFRASDSLRSLFVEPFLTSWIFDVEIIARLTQQRRQTGGAGPARVIVEAPLQHWQDVAGSRLKPGDFVKAFFEIWTVYFRYLRDRD